MVGTDQVALLVDVMINDITVKNVLDPILVNVKFVIVLKLLMGGYVNVRRINLRIH